jgi:hypothetical protein
MNYWEHKREEKEDGKGVREGGFCSIWNLGITFVSIIILFLNTHPHFFKSLNAKKKIVRGFTNLSNCIFPNLGIGSTILDSYCVLENIICTHFIDSIIF